MRILGDFAVFRHDGTLQDTGRRNQQLVCRIAMEGLRQLGRLHDNLGGEMQKGHFRRCQCVLDPGRDIAIEVQPSILHQFGDLPTGDNANAERAIFAKFEKIPVPWLESIWLSNLPNPNVGVQQNHARPSPRWRRVPTAHGTRAPNCEDFPPRRQLVRSSSRPPTPQPVGRVQMEVPSERFPHAPRR